MKTAWKTFVVLLPLLFLGIHVYGEDTEPTRAADLLPPVRVAAAGEPIIADGRCGALTMGDFDDDGDMDLLVGQMHEGLLRIYPNVGTRKQPKFGKGADFIAGGERAFVPTGCYTTFRPQLVDFDGDGRTDILTPSFNNGIFLFRRNEDGSFAAAQMLADRNGQLIEFRYNGTALACDWDADGDLDLVTRGKADGSRTGIDLIVNEGTRKKPAFGEIRELKADGSRIVGNPCAFADWDGDGNKDLLTCSGSVHWYRNIGESGEPKFRAKQVLVPSGNYEKIERLLDEPFHAPDQPGRIDSICATDVNGDGRLDLLAVSTWSEEVALPGSSEERQAANKELWDRANALSAGASELQEARDGESDAARAERQRAMLQLSKESAELRAAWRRNQSRRDYGCVWFFRRGAAND